MNNPQNTHNPARPRIVVIDNYDSFTYNLVHLIHECGESATVWRNDQFALPDLDRFDHILLSPGPGIPAEAGLLLDVIRRYGQEKKIFGICLGMQAIAEVYGGRLYNLDRPVHGTATPVVVLDQSEPLFAGLPDRFRVGRYHSWAVDPAGVPNELAVTAVDERGTIMALAHQKWAVRGVQFHPESVMTEHGRKMMMNWLNDMER